MKFNQSNDRLRWCESVKMFSSDFMILRDYSVATPAFAVIETGHFRTHFHLLDVFRPPHEITAAINVQLELYLVYRKVIDFSCPFERN